MEKTELPKESGDPKRLSWVECEPLPLPQLREGRGVAPSRGDVIEAEVADVNGRAAGKLMLEAIEVEPAQEAGIFARVACTGVVDPELGDYAVQILGMGKDRKEFVVHLCAPQEPGKVWRDGSGSALREVDSFARRSRSRSRRGISGGEQKNRQRFKARDCRGRRREAQAAALAGELGLDPLVRLFEPNLNAPRSSQLEGRDGDLTPRGEAWGPSGRNKDVESRMSVSRVLDSSDSEYAACCGPGPTTRDGISRKTERGTSAF